MFVEHCISAKSFLPAFFLITLLSVPLAAQSESPGAASGFFVAAGAGAGESQAEAEDAARLDAANNVVFKEMRRDAVYRDLFVPEAFKNGWFESIESAKDAEGKWTAAATIRVDESLAEALYLGRYSTTVGALLDEAEEALLAIRALQEAGGTAESNGELGPAESAYRRAESKSVETMRYLEPIEDAIFFSSVGNRKAPELKALIAAAKAACADGIARIRAVQERLAMDAEARNVLDLLDSVEAELENIEETADALHPLAAAPRSYETRLLRLSRERGEDALESLERRRGIVNERTAALGVDMSYPKTRADLVLDRIDALDESLDTSVRAIAAELRKRTPVVRFATWAVAHEPRDYLSIGYLIPYGIALMDGGTERAELNSVWEARAEGALPMSGGGFWIRGRLKAGDEDLTGASDRTTTMAVDIGFFSDRLFGLGFRWDWRREDGSGNRIDSIPAIAVTFGGVGEGLGEKTYAPQWTLTAAWEFPDGEVEEFGPEAIPLDLMNLTLDAVIRPSSWVRFDADASFRTRTRESADWWIGSAGVGIGFRLPILKPLLWRLRWEGCTVAPVLDNEIERDAAKSTGAFRFGFEYTF